MFEHGSIQGDKCKERHVFERKVTIYRKGEFLGAIHRIEARVACVRVGSYAQYGNAVAVSFLRARERNEREFVDSSYQTSVLVLDGWGHPAPDGGFEAKGAGSQQSKYLSHDPRWQEDFDKMINAYIESSGAKVLFDVRGKSAY